MKFLTLIFAATLTATAATNELGDTIVTNLPIVVVRPVMVAPAVRAIAALEKQPIYPNSLRGQRKAAALKEYRQTGSISNIVRLNAALITPTNNQ
jgi:hypothetical protein